LSVLKIAPGAFFWAVFDHTARAYNSITAGFIITFCGKPCCLSKQACFDIFLICPLTLDLPDVILTILFCAYNIVANSATTTTTLPRQLSRQRNVSVLPAAALFLLSFLSGIWVALLYSEVVTLFHRSCHLYFIVVPTDGRAGRLHFVAALIPCNEPTIFMICSLTLDLPDVILTI
jgi:hypothetical protein